MVLVVDRSLHRGENHLCIGSVQIGISSLGEYRNRHTDSRDGIGNDSGKELTSHYGLPLASAAKIWISTAFDGWCGSCQLHCIVCASWLMESFGHQRWSAAVVSGCGSCCSYLKLRKPRGKSLTRATTGEQRCRLSGPEANCS